MGMSYPPLSHGGPGRGIAAHHGPGDQTLG